MTSPVIWTPGGFNFYDTAQMRLYMQSVHDTFIALGLTQTGDSGQLDISTAVAQSGTVGARYNYTYLPLLYKWQGVDGYPDLYIYLAFNISNRFSTNVANIPSIQVAIGRSTTGTGGLTSGTFLWAQPNVTDLQSGYGYLDDNLGGVAAVGDDFLTFCCNPGRHSNFISGSQYPHTWGVPFFAVQRQKNGSFHTTQVVLTQDIRNAALPTATAPINILSMRGSTASTLNPACAFVNAPVQFAGDPVIQKFYRFDASLPTAEFTPMIAVPSSYQYGSSIEIDGKGYTSCGPGVGARISSTIANTWYPAIRTV